MIKVGALCRRNIPGGNDQEILCQITSLYDHRDIDPECVESVAIIPFVKAIWLSGENQGQEFRSARRNFYRAWEVISES